MTEKTARKSATRARKTAATDSRLPAPASQLIDRRLQELGAWRGPVLQRVRALIHEAVPEVVEEWKWQKASSPGTPVWSYQGGICTGESYKQVVKLTFFNGASLPDPSRLFNASLEGNRRRAIDIREGDAIDEAAFRDLVRAAVAFNVATRKERPMARTMREAASPFPQLRAARGGRRALSGAATGVMCANMLRAFQVGKARTSHDGPHRSMRPSRTAAAQLTWPACHLTNASASAVT
jgi:hypothetical protein